MAKIFVSHSSDDHYFVSLLVKLLQYHYLDAWCSLSDIQPGTLFPTEIDHAIKDANILLVVTSANTTRSKWVPKEITEFQTQRSGAVVIPLLLDETHLGSIVPGLDQVRPIDFTRSMLDGYEVLFKLLGKEFLSFEDRRQINTRRNQNDRRSQDRRKANLVQRIRLGFWKTYSQSTGKGEFDEIIDSVREKIKICSSLQSEASKYTYFDDDNRQCEPKQVLDLSTHRIWNAMKDGGTFKPIYLIEAIAEDICEKYQIKVNSERRRTVRRAGQGRRRD